MSLIQKITKSSKSFLLCGLGVFAVLETIVGAISFESDFNKYLTTGVVWGFLFIFCACSVIRDKKERIGFPVGIRLALSAVPAVGLSLWHPWLGAKVLLKYVSGELGFAVGILLVYMIHFLCIAILFVLVIGITVKSIKVINAIFVVRLVLVVLGVAVCASVLLAVVSSLTQFLGGYNLLAGVVDAVFSSIFYSTLAYFVVRSFQEGSSSDQNNLKESLPQQVSNPTGE